MSGKEELVQKNYLTDDGLIGEKFGRFEKFSLTQTTAATLKGCGLQFDIPARFRFAAAIYKQPSKPSNLKVDDLVCLRGHDGALKPVLVVEYKSPGELDKSHETCVAAAAEQAVSAGEVFGVGYAATTDGATTKWYDVRESLAAGKPIPLAGVGGEVRPGTLADVLTSQTGLEKDPSELAESVWQKLFVSTKAEPKDCLLTFVEIFMLKFLSDNLPDSKLAKTHSFYYLLKDPDEFMRENGKSQIEYYITTTRQCIKNLFPDNNVLKDHRVKDVFFGKDGSYEFVSKTSIINGFVFVKSGAEAMSTLNTVFLDILRTFDDFGKLSAIEPEFKLRLYETFLKKSAGKQQLGQFFTPRNIVRPMVRMAQLDKLGQGSVVLDPACGVGGFILEPLLWENSLKGNISFDGGRVSRKVVTIGVDNDRDLHLLAKSNMLIHLSDALSDPTVSVEALNTAMADTFLLMDKNQTLGSLALPPRDSVDVVLANPPYVTNGSRIYKEAAEELGMSENSVNLQDYYRNSGLGLEGLFLTYIAGSLKPGGTAFVIVPRGMLNRTESNLKGALLESCNLIASIELPRNAFFTTAQLTQILVLRKRYSEGESRPDVLCAIARSIGETLDSYRTPIESNDLEQIASCFIAVQDGTPLEDAPPFVKMVSSERFSKRDRWDVRRFWSEEEKVSLGLVDKPISKTDYIASTIGTLQELLDDLRALGAREAPPEPANARVCLLSDEKLFKVSAGGRINKSEIDEHPPADEADAVPVYSCFRNENIVKGVISRKYLETKPPIKGEYRHRPIAKRLVTVNANGASVGLCYVREPGCALTDDVITVEVLDRNIDPFYLRETLQDAINAGNYIYEAKLFQNRLKELAVTIPVDEDGEFDLEAQRRVAGEDLTFAAIQSRLSDIGSEADSVRFHSR